MFNLGLLLEEQGKTREALEWYRRAAELGHKEAKAKIEKLGAGG